MFQALKTCVSGSRELDGIWSGPGDDVIALHGPDGRFVKISEAAQQIFGVPEDTLIGMRLMDVFAPAHQDRLLAALADVGRPNGDGTGRFEARIRISDRLGPAVEVTLARLKNGRLRSVTRNIEQRLAREETIRKEGREAVSLAARRSEQLANVSHEIRTPLNAVIGFADALYAERFGPLGNDKYRDYARVIQESGQHLLSLITDWLDLSKAEANETTLEMAPEDPGALVNLCAEIMRLRASDAGLYIATEIEPGLGPVMLDAKVIRQIVLNLLSNALKFTETGGITATVRREGAVLAISVIDTGVGMSPDDLSIVGQRFKQARSEGVRGARGTGIGLSLSKALARLHGGELKLMSSVGEGTTALLRLPFEAAPRQTNPFLDNAPNVTSIANAKRA
ncbi:HAMP domain-containing sensor histidine kinase [Parvularcula sp. LCG005]|uniref:PAS domain-containing sensor histidine kinase n=1 Tax=Parvularcula sp. LCG005 TaxID=3078805 RepID=UPI002943A7CD|nr:HAMP domain-containing sensor histidine kinase [Parvularcula sp. LCG005]WOI53983.1 HAMP domain-containing sensor histidine kinase [Parvularcula sp. LCG005]